MVILTRHSLWNLGFYFEYFNVVNPKFRDAYFSNNVEDNFLALLKKNTSVQPLCNVVTCYDSFGGFLATKLPSNLNVIRVEHTIDPYASIPGDVRYMSDKNPFLKL